MRTILAPTDFTDVSLNAVNYAAKMASTLGINLTLLHVCPTTMTYTEIPPPVMYVEEAISSAESQLKQLKERILSDYNKKINIDTKVLMGEIVQSIKSYCEQIDVYAVAMGADSESTFDRLFFGGHTIEAVKSLPYPIIIVPAGFSLIGLSKIGLASDFKDVSNTVPVDEILKLTKEFNSELHVIHVQDEDEKISEIETSEATRWFKDHLGILNPKFHFLISDDIEKGINDYIDNNNLEMLIITPKKHGFFNKLLRSSISKRIVLRAHIPILSIHE